MITKFSKHDIQHFQKRKSISIISKNIWIKKYISFFVKWTTHPYNVCEYLSIRIMHIRHINSLCCLDNVLQYFHTKLIVQTHSFHDKVVKQYSVKVGILRKSTQSKLLQALNWQITYPNKKNDFGTMQFFKNMFLCF